MKIYFANCACLRKNSTELVFSSTILMDKSLYPRNQMVTKAKLRTLIMANICSFTVGLTL